MPRDIASDWNAYMEALKSTSIDVDTIAYDLKIVFEAAWKAGFENGHDAFDYEDLTPEDEHEHSGRIINGINQSCPCGYLPSA